LSAKTSFFAPNRTPCRIKLLSTQDFSLHSIVDRASVEKMMNILDDRGGYRVIITDDNLVAVYDNSYTENVTNKLILLQEIRVAMEGNDVFIVSHAEDRIISKRHLP
jgi:hypothetical protein